MMKIAEGFHLSKRDGIPDFRRSIQGATSVFVLLSPDFVLLSSVFQLLYPNIKFRKQAGRDIHRTDIFFTFEVILRNSKKY
jgi:hypothetical protein